MSVHLDHPGEITWHDGEPLPVVGPCPHDCDHGIVSEIAWGPDHEHYSLRRCIIGAHEGGCDGQCRAWLGQWDAYEAHRAGRPRFYDHPFLHVPDPGVRSPYTAKGKE